MELNQFIEQRNGGNLPVTCHTNSHRPFAIFAQSWVFETPPQNQKKKLTNKYWNTDSSNDSSNLTLSTNADNSIVTMKSPIFDTFKKKHF